jgi:hypothetical protein
LYLYLLSAADEREGREDWWRLTVVAACLHSLRGHASLHSLCAVCILLMLITETFVAAAADSPEFE